MSRSYRFYHFSRFNISFLITSGTWWFRLPLFQKEYNGHLPVPAVLSLSSQPSHNFHTVPSELCAQSLSFHIVSALQLLDREESFLLRKGRIKVGWHLRLLKMMERLMWFDSIEWKVYGVRVWGERWKIGKSTEWNRTKKMWSIAGHPWRHNHDSTLMARITLCEFLQ